MNVEWLILADAAEVNGGKLYLLGGGWNQLAANKFPFPHNMAIAVSFKIPWTQTNEKHSFEISIADSDGRSVAKVPGQFEVGRPVGVPVGQEQRAQIVVNLNWTINQAGGYAVAVRLNGEEGGLFPFSVVVGPKQS